MSPSQYRGYVLIALFALALAPPVGAQSPCAPSPRFDCRRSERGQLLLKNDQDPSGRRLAWRWRNGEATALADFGDPLSAGEHGVCLYSGPDHVLVLDAAVPPGAPQWRRAGERGYRYLAEGEPVGGIKAVGLKAGAAGKSSVSVVGRNLPLPIAAGPAALPLTIQLVSAGTGVCWESVYSADNRPQNEEGTFRARHVGIPRPSLILISGDDQRWDTLPYMPSTMAEIAGKGVRFENAFSPNPVCLPSRASLLTGNYSHTHQVLSNSAPEGGPLRFVGPDRQTIAVWLQAQGYRTGFFGKYHGYGVLCGESSCPIPPGWDEWHSFIYDDYFNYEVSENGAIVAYGNAPEDYSTDVMRDKVLDFLDAHRDEPFFVHFTPFAPHASVSAGLFPVPAPRHFDILLGLAPWRPLNYMEADVTDKPGWIQARPATLTPSVTAYHDAIRRKGLESLRAVDEAIAALLAELEEQGRITDTIVIFTSDHGYSYDEHRLFAKLCPYDECLRVPLVMRYPRLFRDQPVVRHGLASLIDLAPTIAEWTGVPAGAVPPIRRQVSGGHRRRHGERHGRGGAVRAVAGPPLRRRAHLELEIRRARDGGARAVRPGERPLRAHQRRRPTPRGGGRPRGTHHRSRWYGPLTTGSRSKLLDEMAAQPPDVESMLGGEVAHRLVGRGFPTRRGRTMARDEPRALRLIARG